MSIISHKVKHKHLKTFFLGRVAKPLNNKYMSVRKYISNCPFHTTSVACTTTTAKKGYSKPHDTLSRAPNSNAQTRKTQ